MSGITLKGIVGPLLPDLAESIVKYLDDHKAFKADADAATVGVRKMTADLLSTHKDSAEVAAIVAELLGIIDRVASDRPELLPAIVPALSDRVKVHAKDLRDDLVADLVKRENAKTAVDPAELHTRWEALKVQRETISAKFGAIKQVAGSFNLPILPSELPFPTEFSKIRGTETLTVVLPNLPSDPTAERAPRLPGQGKSGNSVVKVSSVLYGRWIDDTFEVLSGNLLGAKKAAERLGMIAVTDDSCTLIPSDFSPDKGPRDRRREFSAHVMSQPIGTEIELPGGIVGLRVDGTFNIGDVLALVDDRWQVIDNESDDENDENDDENENEN